jgi:hypothetical protein
MLVIWRPGPWLTAALRAGGPSAALSRGGSYRAQSFFRAGQVQVVPLFWSFKVRSFALRREPELAAEKAALLAAAAAGIARIRLASPFDRLLA